MGDLNIHKLRQRYQDQQVLEAEIEKVCEERLERLAPLFQQIDFGAIVQKTPELKFLDLGCNDGTILFALKRKYKDITLFGLEHLYNTYKSTIEYLQSRATITIKSGSWYDDVYPENHFDIVSSIHAWPLPPNYLNKSEEIEKVNGSGKMFQHILFDKKFSLNELKRFMTFLKPGGYLILKTWKTRLEKKRFNFRITPQFPFLVPQDETPSFNIVKNDLRPIGSIIYLDEVYLILDIGAGQGGFAEHLKLANMVFPNLYPLDSNTSTVEALKSISENAMSYTAPEELPFADNTVSYIHCSHMVEHLYHAELYSFLKEIDRVLKKNGILVISSPLLWPYFYNDLSHVKPYYPNVFLTYLCHRSTQHFAEAISEDYSVLKEAYRYTNRSQDEWGSDYLFIDFLIHCSKRICRKLKIKKYSKNAYTLILKKGNDIAGT